MISRFVDTLIGRNSVIGRTEKGRISSDPASLYDRRRDFHVRATSSDVPIDRILRCGEDD